ncbi:MAG: hypothetical protein GF388_10170 [Candidatus Aegiribacteria sp.]|nr:hypothetical protein [Candidatus Aegiribacteria sp.]MBD3295398.1 hypothetical protein [Candidatus Fermentibacteria bacterium]
MKNLILIASALVLLPLSAMAVQTETYGWEDGNTVLGTYGNANVDLSSSTYHSGAYALEIYEYPLGGTPQAYVGWVKDLADGDTVMASFWVYDTTPSTNPSGRIWGHWNDDPTDPNGYNGSASGNSEYSAGTGWSQLEHEWTVVDGHTGLMIEARIYSGSEYDTIWVDDLTIEAPDGATIELPNIPVALQRRTWGDIKAIF